jgi:hypothetical protein
VSLACRRLAAPVATAAIFAAEPAADLVELVLDRFGGNAYLVEELAGLIRGGGNPADLPPSLRDVLLSRVDSLSTGAQRLLRTAAVAGRSVPDKLLAEISSVSEPELYAGLREAVESHLLVIDHTGRGYAFRHALTRDAVYEDMLPGERGELHAAYGKALTREPGLAGDDAALPAADALRCRAGTAGLFVMPGMRSWLACCPGSCSAGCCGMQAASHMPGQPARGSSAPTARSVCARSAPARIIGRMRHSRSPSRGEAEDLGC